MPQSIAVGLLVLGGVLLLVGITGGDFKIFGAEVDSPISNAPVRFIAGLLGVALIVTSLAQNKLSGTPPAPTPANNQSASSSGPKAVPASPSIPVIPQGQPADAKSGGASEPSSASNKEPITVTSANEFAIVFDPPSNIRAQPSAASGTLCSVTAKTSIRILGSEGNWYRTDICDGRLGYIHRSQVKF